MEENLKTEELNRYLEFDLGNQSYAVHLLSVKEVITVPDTTPLPNGPDYFVGIMNLRGQIISVVDLRKKLRIESKTLGLEEAVVIVDLQGVSIGLIVDSINKVLNFSISDITEVPEVQSQVNAKYIQGVYRGEGKLSVLLDLENVLNINEIKSYQKEVA
ncbi:MAG: hypothetical protein HOE90_22445 [Bacteriovoracaceae bacterium]|jgi:purine-binding chemotaxis protein CheW|nr:hypothetical protein [Bacteriovoracaceae bacterium]